MKKKYKLIVLAFVVALLTISFSLLSLFTVSADTYQLCDFTSGDYSYYYANVTSTANRKSNTPTGYVVISRYCGNDEIVEIPSVLDGYTVIGIDGYTRISQFYVDFLGAFENNTSIKKVVVPNTIKYISYYTGGDDENWGYAVFRNCPNLEEVIFRGNTLKEISMFSFDNCPKLTDIFIPSNADKIDPYVFDGSVTLKGYVGSPAESYAALNNLNFVAVESPVCDLDENHIDNINDVTFIQQYIAKLVDFTEEQLNTADVNGDGAINIIDVTALQKKIAGLDYQ